jgi:hypothetical protein
MMEYETKVLSSAEMKESQRRALGRLGELEAERRTLPGRISEAATADSRRRIESAKRGESGGMETDPELSALTRREADIDYEIHAARVAAAELEIETLEAGMRERREAYEELAPAEETARVGYEEAKDYYEEVKRERGNLAPGGMQDYDLRRAQDALRQIEAEATHG